MAKTLEAVDAVVIGVGMSGSIIAHELTKAGQKVVGLERGAGRNTVPDFQAPAMHDELKYSVRKGLMQSAQNEAVTLRNNTDQTALPIRRWQAFLPGTGLGGSAVHWNGNIWRFQEADFVLKSHIEKRYGKDFIDPRLSIQDWGVTYADLEPHYTRFENLYGACGKAGNIQGKIQPGGNPFEAPRSTEYPNKPMKQTYACSLFSKAAESLGYKPFPMPSCTMSQRYTNPLGLTMEACVMCGFCERFGCEHKAKASPQTTILPVLLKSDLFELRTHAQVQKVQLDKQGKKATGVTYVNAAGEEVFQPAKLVIMSMFSLNNVRMMLLSGIGKPYDPKTQTGVVGRNYTYQTISGAQVFFDDDVRVNPFMASGSTMSVIDEFSGDNFDHSELGFIGGAYLYSNITNGQPIGFHPVPPGTPRWGQEFKQAMLKHYNHTVKLGAHGSSMPTPTNYLDLDPTYKDAWGQPLLRMTFDFTENDIKMSAYITSKLEQIGKAMGGKQVVASPRKGPFDSNIYQSTHNCGGAVMGADPKTSAVNPYLQCWDVSNVFVVGASAFVHNGSYNPTGTLGALTYHAAEALTTKYLKSPGPLVSL
ncbi:GMC family oxidoreductase [Shewanella gaetbuli]